MTVSQPFWYTAEEAHQLIQRKITISQAEGFRWLKEVLDMLPFAIQNDDIDRCLIPPTTSINTRWDTLIAAAFRWKLRTLNHPAPPWTFKEPLDTLWFPYSAKQSYINNEILLAPTELRRVGIMLPEAALH